MFTSDFTGESHCIVAVDILVDSINVQLYHKSLPFVSEHTAMILFG